MEHITRIAAIETIDAIWTYNPADPSNRVHGGSLDVIATIQTLGVKITASGQRIEQFEKIQVNQSKQSKPLKIILYGNTRWGSAYGMLNAIKLHPLYGPITTICNSYKKISKKIAWLAFSLDDDDWERVAEARDILGDSNNIQQYFSSECQPTLWHALPAIEELLTKWEEKAVDPRFALYTDAIADGREKILKYYNKFDAKLCYILALVLHPYYKLDYIEHAWGGHEEQLKEIKEGNKFAKNWQAKALKIVKAVTSKYYAMRPCPEVEIVPSASVSALKSSGSLLKKDFTKHRNKLIGIGGNTSEGWEGKLRHYLKDRPVGVELDMDIVLWWQEHQYEYPTLARIAPNVLPIPASSTPSERLFSASGQTAKVRRSCLGSVKFAWHDKVENFASWNS